MENCRTPDLWVKNTWLPESFPFKQSIDLGLPWRSGHATDTWLYIEGLIWVIQNGIDQIGYMVVPPELCIWFTNHGNYMITGNFRYHFLIGGLEHFFFPIYWEFHHRNWLSYFSEGLKPPTSFIYLPQTLVIDGYWSYVHLRKGLHCGWGFPVHPGSLVWFKYKACHVAGSQN